MREKGDGSKMGQRHISALCGLVTRDPDVWVRRCRESSKRVGVSLSLETRRESWKEGSLTMGIGS